MSAHHPIRKQGSLAKTGSISLPNQQNKTFPPTVLGFTQGRPQMLAVNPALTQAIHARRVNNWEPTTCMPKSTCYGIWNWGCETHGAQSERKFYAGQSSRATELESGTHSSVLKYTRQLIVNDRCSTHVLKAHYMLNQSRITQQSQPNTHIQSFNNRLEHCNALRVLGAHQASQASTSSFNLSTEHASKPATANWMERPKKPDR